MEAKEMALHHLNKELQLNSKWLQGLKTDKERADFKKIVLNSKITLDKLKDIVYNSYIGCLSVTQTDYDNPSWAAKQAHLNGKMEAYTELLQLLTFEDDSLHKTKRKALTDATRNIRTTSGNK